MTRVTQKIQLKNNLVLYHNYSQGHQARVFNINDFKLLQRVIKADPLSNLIRTDRH